MSIEFLQVSGNRTSLRAPDSTVQSGLTSLTSGCVLANGGLDVTQAGVLTHGLFPQTDSQTVLLTDSTTIPAVAGVVQVSASAARFGLIMGVPTPTKTGATVKILNTSGVNHVFATVATSRVADGNNLALRSLSSTELVYHAPNNLWYQVGRV